MLAHCTAMMSRRAAYTVGLPDRLDQHEALFGGAARRGAGVNNLYAKREPEKDGRRALLGPHGYDAVSEGAVDRPPGGWRTEAGFRVSAARPGGMHVQAHPCCGRAQ